MSVSVQRKRVMQVFATAAVLALGVLSAVRTTAGIQGSGIRFASIGPISSVGSGQLVVGGIQYSTSGAHIEVDGDSGNVSQLHAGDVVSIGGPVGSGGAWTATAVAFSGNVRGAVSGIDIPSGTLYVLGQTVLVTSDTLFDSSIQPAGLQGLSNGASVEVSGFADSSGNIVATRISTTGNSQISRVVGTLQNLNPNAQTFSINSLVVSYANALVNGALAEGVPVTVQGTQPLANGTWRAAKVAVVSPPQNPAGTQGQIQGLITDFASANYFEIDGQPVIVNAQTQLNLLVPLGLNVAVMVTGTFDQNGVLVAHNVHSRTRPWVAP